MGRGSARRSGCWILLTPALGLLAACSSGGTAATSKRTAGVYAAVILAAIEGQPTTSKTPVVFVVPRSDTKPIPLDVQASVVHELTGRVAIRFVDTDDEAIDNAANGRPVKEGVLVHLGPVATTGDPVVVEADRYRTATDDVKLTLSVRSSGDRWSARIIAASPAAPVG